MLENTKDLTLGVGEGRRVLGATFEDLNAIHTDKLLCAILRPRLKAITALCIITAIKIAIISPVSLCRPIARPFKLKSHIGT